MPTVSYGIANTADDVFFAPGFGIISTNVAAGTASGFSYFVGLRFPTDGSAPPQGSTISEAYIDLVKDGANSTAGSWGAIKGVATDNAPVWSVTNPSAAPKTTASTAIADGATQRIDVTAQVQEIINRTGWAPGNAIAFAGDPAGATGLMAWVDYSTSTTNCAQLSITYEAGGPDVTPPTITSANTASVAENATLAHSLTANEAVTWSIIGGADQAQFEISGSTLRWASNGTRDYESPADADGDNAYVVTVRATDGASNTTDQTIAVTVTDVGWSAPLIGGAVTVASGNITVTEPSGAAEGDLIVVPISFRSNVAFALPSTGGWQLAATQQSGGNTTANGTGSIGGGLIAYCIRGSSAPSYTFTRTGGDVGIGRALAYRYDAPGTISLDTGSSNTLPTASTTVTTAGVTTTTAGSLIFAALFGARNVTATAFDAATDPTTASGATNMTSLPTSGTWIERADSGTTTGADAALAVADAIRSSAGATGTVQVTASASARHAMAVAAFKVVDSGGAITGAASVTLGAATGSGAGSLQIKATSAPKLGVATTSGTGSLTVKAMASAALGAATAAGVGSLQIGGATDATLGSLGGASAASLPVSGIGNVTLEILTGSGAGALSIAAQASIALGFVTTMAEGDLPIDGDAAAALSPLTLSASGHLPISATLSAPLGPLTGLGSGSFGETATGEASGTLGSLIGASTGGLLVRGSASFTLDHATGAGAGSLQAGGRTSGQLGHLTGAATGVLFVSASATVSLGPVSTSLAGRLPITASTLAGLSPVVGAASGYFVRPFQPIPARQLSGQARDRSLEGAEASRVMIGAHQTRDLQGMPQDRSLAALRLSRAL